MVTPQHATNPTSSSAPRYCEQCGAVLATGQAFCERCGAQIVTLVEESRHDGPHLPLAAASTRGGAPDDAGLTEQEWDDVIVWKADVPLINNRFMLKDIGFVAIGTIVFMQVILALVGLFAGEGIVTLPWQVYVGIAVVFAVGFLIVALLFYQNRFHMQFAVGPEGVVAETGGKERAFTRATILAGALAGSPAAAGAGMLAAAREITAISWDDVERVKVYPGPRVITLGSRWRTIVRLNCTPENFATVAERVQTYSAQREARLREQPQAAAPASTWRAFAPFIVWVALAVLFGVMTRAWYWAAEDTELIVLIAVALLIPAGLVGRTGWVLALPSGAMATLALLITIANGMEESTSMFGGTYSMFELDTGDFWVTIAGCAGLILLSLMTVFGFGPHRWRGGKPEESRGLIDTEQ